MKRAFSLKGRKAFKEVFQNGKRYRQKGFQIIVLYGDQPYTKMGISINRRYGKACERNLAKRQIRAIWTGSFANIKQGFRIVIRPENEAKLMKYNEKELILKKLLCKAEVWENGGSGASC